MAHEPLAVDTVVDIHCWCRRDAGVCCHVVTWCKQHIRHRASSQHSSRRLLRQ